MRYLRLYLALTCLLFGCEDYWTPSQFPATVALSEELTNQQKANIIEACMQWNAAVETEVFEIINYDGKRKDGLILFTGKKPRPGAFASTLIFKNRAQVNIGTDSYVGVFEHELLHTLGYREHDKDKNSIIYAVYLGPAQQILPSHVQYIKERMPILKDDEKAPEGKPVHKVFQTLYNNSFKYHNSTPKEPMNLKIKSNQIRDRIYNLGGHDIAFNYEGVGYIDVAYRMEIEKALLLQQGFFRIIEDAPVVVPEFVETLPPPGNTKEAALEKMFGPNADLSANFTLLLAETGCDNIDEAWQEYRKLLGESAPSETLPVVAEDNDEDDIDPEASDEEDVCEEEEYIEEIEEDEPLPEEIVDVEIEKLEAAATPTDPQPKRGRGRPRLHPEPEGGSYYMKNKKKKATKKSKKK